MNYKNKAGRLFETLIQNSTSSRFKQFFYRSRSTVLVTLLIASAKDGEQYSLENILERIPRKLVSRTSVKNILDEAVTQEFYFNKVILPITDFVSVEIRYKYNPLGTSFPSTLLPFQVT